MKPWTTSSVTILLCGFCAFGVPLPMRADAPLPPLRDHIVCSGTGDYCAHIAVEREEIGVYAGEQLLWTVHSLCRDVFVANDGEHMMCGYDGRNLLRHDYRADTPMLRFWHRDILIRTITLAELIKDFARLEATVSHFRWGHHVGIDAQNRFVVHTIEDQRIAFDIETGEISSVSFERYPGH
jgi:hypothetical protein